VSPLWYAPHFPRGMSWPPLLHLRRQALPVSQCLGAVGRPLSATMTRSSGAVGRPLIARRWRGASASSVVTRSRKDVDCAGANNGALAPSFAAPCSCDDEEVPRRCLSPLARMRMSTAAAQTIAPRWEQCLVLGRWCVCELCAVEMSSRSLTQLT
jgi:hypothetical protein